MTRTNFSRLLMLRLSAEVGAGGDHSLSSSMLKSRRCIIASFSLGAVLRSRREKARRISGIERDLKMRLVSGFWQDSGGSEDSVVVVDFDDSRILNSLDFSGSVVSVRRDLKRNS